MNKKTIINKHFQKVDQLTITKAEYRDCVDGLFEWILKNDMVQRDKTTKSLFSKSPKEITAKIITKQTITVAGIEEAVHLLESFTEIQTTFAVKDGSHLTAKQTLLELKGNPAEILAYERTVLNILQRLSGIATATQAIVKQVQGLDLQNPPLIASTRKTQWILLDKKAVALGGGATHRLNLADGILVKDNHLLILKEQYGLTSEPELVAKTVELLSKTVKDTLIEIEIEQKDSIDALIKAAPSLRKNNNTLCVMLDNFAAGDVKAILAAFRKKYDLSDIIFEASGGITNETITDWAKTGVDVLSLGSLTHSTKAVDLSLDIL